MQRPSGLIKIEGSASTFQVKNVSWKWIPIINLNCYHITDLSGCACVQTYQYKVTFYLYSSNFGWAKVSKFIIFSYFIGKLTSTVFSLYNRSTFVSIQSVCGICLTKFWLRFYPLFCLHFMILWLNSLLLNLVTPEYAKNYLFKLI